MADYVLCMVYDPRSDRLWLAQLSDDEIRKRCAIGQRVLRDPADERDQMIREVFRQETQAADDPTLYKKMTDRIKRRKTT